MRSSHSYCARAHPRSPQCRWVRARPGLRTPRSRRPAVQTSAKTRWREYSREHPNQSRRHRERGARPHASAPTYHPEDAPGRSGNRRRAPRPRRTSSRGAPGSVRGPADPCRYPARDTGRYHARPAWGRRSRRTRGTRAQPRSGTRPRPRPRRSNPPQPHQRSPPGRHPESSGEPRPPSRRRAGYARCAGPGARCARPPTSTRPATRCCVARPMRP